MAFPDAQSPGWVCDSSRAGVLRAGAELEQRDECHGGTGGEWHWKAPGPTGLVGDIHTLKGTINTLLIKFTGETQLG